MRITLEPTTDGRWQLFVDYAPDDPMPRGEWQGTYRPRAVGLAVARLVHAAQLAGTASLPKRTKGSGG
jgi:hypothetical protein